MTDDLTKRLDWATPAKPHFDSAGLARALRWFRPRVDSHGNCRARRWGRCPGISYCPDCPWAEGRCEP
jgi:hypothetical protein